MSLLNKLKKELKENSNFERAKINQKFFKTRKGEYGEGDIFLGIDVPIQRRISKKYLDLSLVDLQELLESKVHEHRFVALVILINKFSIKNKFFNKEKSRGFRKQIFNFYIKNTKNINNWDLVDISAPNIIGNYLLENSFKKSKQRECNILYKLALSKNLWERRVAIISTFSFIRERHFNDAFKISKILLKDEHDLIHKAVGWMLREVGKRDQKILEGFLIKNYKNIHRTTIRYAIEKFPEKLREKYLRGNLI